MAIPVYSQKRAVQDNLPTNVSSESEESSSDFINAVRLETPANIIRMQTTFGNQKNARFNQTRCRNDQPATDAKSGKHE